MPIWNTIKSEIERAGRAANSALDEGKLRLTLIQARKTADRSAQRLGYALFRAKARGVELSVEEYNLHASKLSDAEAEIARIETLLKEAAADRKPGTGEPTGPAPDPAKAPTPAGDAPKEPEGGVEP